MGDFFVISPEEVAIFEKLISNKISRCFPRSLRHSNPLGLAFINSNLQPTTAILWDKNTNFFLYGNPSNSQFNAGFIDYFKKKIRPQQLQKLRPGSYTIYFESQWKSMIPQIFADPMPDLRIHLIFQCQEFPFQCQELPKRSKNDFLNNIRVPPDYLLHPVDHTFLQNRTWDNSEALMDEIQGNWGSQAHYLAHGFGFCITYGQRIVAWIFSEANHNQTCEVGIETEEEHQRKGLATALIQAFKFWAENQQYTQIEWDCWKSNISSFTLAKKAGFEDTLPYSVYFGWFHPIDHLIVNGYQYLNAYQDYQKAISFYEQVVSNYNQNHPDLASSFFLSRSGIKQYYYYLSASYAQLEDFPQADLYFNLALDHGWTDAEEFRNCGLFDAFRQSPFGQQILEKLKGGLE